MKSLSRAWAWPIILSASLVSLSAHGQEAKEPSVATTATEELRSLRRLLEAQGKQLEQLNEQVSQLRQQIGNNPAAHDSSASSHESGAISASAPAPAPAPSEPVGDAPPASATPAGDGAHAAAGGTDIPRAEATGGGVKHLVAKGETLTSIAKHYNVSLADLQKANKSLNERKLQIGQVVSIPSSATPSSPATPDQPAAPEKKETH